MQTIAWPAPATPYNTDLPHLRGHGGKLTIAITAVAALIGGIAALMG